MRTEPAGILACVGVCSLVREEFQRALSEALMFSLRS